MNIRFGSPNDAPLVTYASDEPLTRTAHGVVARVRRAYERLRLLSMDAASTSAAS
jgi:hypothetical protein